ncbi:hypothetical protein M0813_24236 [Anaeramoeba flamelloides]|uniref:Uncharacterized protein n=1 Tax=Anaeramoeba flamelloides TaxID=1746091 RepID=A0ABQ8Y832_9EUKA|nr:hypothetical protein M0813_30096 [Anaeramoeba flamelloides]KAJ6240378.1 hypothetical protein M0813_24236 [Anaeramoeba flamelloides]
MHHHFENHERAVNLSILIQSGSVNMKADRVNISCHFLFKSKFGKVSRLLFTVATGAVSQAPSPVSNPNSPDPLLSS